LTVRHLPCRLVALWCMLLCGCPGEVPDEHCNDFTDNDGDGSIDCDDSDCASWPGCDDGDDDAGDDDTGGQPDDDDTSPVDADGDGWDSDEDCDDSDAQVHPDAEEVCNGVDDDCDATTDEDGDADADGFSTCGGDCDDGDDQVHPDAVEVCNGVDDDCDPATDEDLDDDGDGLSECQGDCDDSEFLVPLHATEDTCDGVDSDCDGVEEGPCTPVALSLAGAKLLGSPCDMAGGSVAGAGDVNGDGYDDVLVGAIRMVHGCDNRGIAYLVHGPVSGSVPLSSADASFPGEDDLDAAGEVVAAAGDVNGDDHDDLLISAPYDNGGGALAGAVYLVHGPVSGTHPLAAADAKLLGQAMDIAGRAISSAGDVDGDDLPDILVGVANNDYNGAGAGVTYVVYGVVSGSFDLAMADGLLAGQSAGDLAGSSVAAAGDMNGDGQDDVLVGAPGHDGLHMDGGAVYLVHGPIAGTLNLFSADASLTGGPGSSVGCSVSSAGDVDGDGNLDVLVGACGDHEAFQDAGAAILVYGPVAGEIDLSVADTRLLGESEGEEAGTSVAGVGDTNGDGFDDLVVGAPSHEVGGDDVGAAFWIQGPVSGSRFLSSGSVTYFGETQDGQAGISVSAAGDLNADGYADIIVGADRVDGWDGAAYLIYGGP